MGKRPSLSIEIYLSNWLTDWLPLNGLACPLNWAWSESPPAGQLKRLLANANEILWLNLSFWKVLSWIKGLTDSDSGCSVCFYTRDLMVMVSSCKNERACLFVCLPLWLANLLSAQRECSCKRKRLAGLRAPSSWKRNMEMERGTGGDVKCIILHRKRAAGDCLARGRQGRGRGAFRGGEGWSGRRRWPSVCVSAQPLACRCACPLRPLCK